MTVARCADCDREVSPDSSSCPACGCTFILILPARKTVAADSAEKLLLVVALHEAGHLVVAHFSTYFGIGELAVQIGRSGEGGALSGVKRLRSAAAEEHRLPSTREIVKIALAGKAAEVVFLSLQPTDGEQLIPNPDGANQDLEYARRSLSGMKILNEYDQLWAETLAQVQKEWALIKKVAAFIFTSSETTIDRATLLKVFDSTA